MCFFKLSDISPQYTKNMITGRIDPWGTPTLVRGCDYCVDHAACESVVEEILYNQQKPAPNS